MRWLVAAITAWLSFFAGLATATPFDFDPPTPSYWHWQVPAETNPAVITITSGLLNYVTPCYRSYPVEFKGGHLKVHPAWHWSAKCTAHDRRSALAFLHALHAAQTAKVEGGHLVFRDQAGLPRPSLDPFDPPDLEYRYWRITSYREKGTMVALLRETHGADGKIRKADLPLAIFANGGLEGGLGCGALVGSYHQDGGSLTIKAASVLAGWCPSEDDRQNRKLLDVLNAVQSLKKVDAGFHLFDDKGNLLAVLAPKDLS